jgi:class 3 adenylate cyclase
VWPLELDGKYRSVGQPQVERRLAAILGDVVGFSRLMGVDEAGTARALRGHREAISPIITEQGGRIVKTIGDGVLLEFPSVVAAVACAGAIQRLMAERNAAAPADQRMLFRIGINLSDVLIEGDDILGDGVNVAARLEEISEAGGICISEDVYRQIDGKVDISFADMGLAPPQEYRARCGPTGREAIIFCDMTDRLKGGYGRPKQKPIVVRTSKYLNNRIEQDHRRIKRRIRPMLGFKSLKAAEIILSGVELIHMMRKRQARFAFNPNPSLAEQFDMLAA